MPEDPTTEPDPKPEPSTDPQDDPKPDDKGFPENTPVAEMTVEQQAAYHKHQARKHEDRSKEWSRTFEGKTPAQIKAELDAAAEVKRAQMSDADKALEEARTTARQEAAKEFGNKLVAAEFRAALAHVDGERRDQIIEGLNLSTYLTDSGDVDTDKVKSYAAAIAPADKGEGTRTHDYGGGRRASGTEQRAGSVAAVMEARRAAREKQGA